jgi:lysozyme family protein
MADFHTALTPTLKAEGGYVNDPQDNGGETYRGISRKNFPKWNGWAFVDTHKPLHTGQLIADGNIDSLVDAFYRSNFWNPIMGDDIINQDVANDLFDSSVNMGVHQAVILSQRSLGIPETGKMDSSTLNILNSQNSFA